jgi:hypothetical protein
VIINTTIFLKVITKFSPFQLAAVEGDVAFNKLKKVDSTDENHWNMRVLDANEG